VRLIFLHAAIEAFSQADSPAREKLRGYPWKPESSAMSAPWSAVTSIIYTLFCPTVLPEDTMISMASSIDESIYSISIFTYNAPARREPYYAFCSVLGARCGSWSAHACTGAKQPLECADSAPLYPRLEEFRTFCRRHDANGVLRNGYTERVLDLPPRIESQRQNRDRHDAGHLRGC
jgi:hypothetical protein